MAGLEMRTVCEGCNSPLTMSDVAFISSYESTFCADCSSAKDHICPNCGGELVRRPRRPA